MRPLLEIVMFELSSKPGFFDLSYLEWWLNKRYSRSCEKVIGNDNSSQNPTTLIFSVYKRYQSSLVRLYVVIRIC